MKHQEEGFCVILNYGCLGDYSAANNYRGDVIANPQFWREYAAQAKAWLTRAFSKLEKARVPYQ